MCICVWVCASQACSCLRKPEEGIRALELGLQEAVEHADCGINSVDEWDVVLSVRKQESSRLELLFYVSYSCFSQSSVDRHSSFGY